MRKTLLPLLITSALTANIQETLSELPIMNQQERKQMPSEWLSNINTSGQFTTKDRLGRAVVLEWKKTDILSPDLATFKRNTCELACEVLAPAEVQFLQTHPQAVSEELFLKPCEPFFKDGLETVDWELVKEKIQATIKQFYLTDLSSFGASVIKPLLNDVYFLVSITDSKNEKLLGFAMFAITPALNSGDIKVINIAISPAEKENGLDQLLMSSIFNIVPQAKRLFLFSRPTNSSALETYRSCGFTQDLNFVQDPNHKVNLEYLIPLEYRAEQSNILQKTAQTL